MGAASAHHGAMAAGLAAIGAIIMPIIIMGAGAGAAPPFRDSLLGSSTVSTTCTIACRGHGMGDHDMCKQALLGPPHVHAHLPTRARVSLSKHFAIPTL